MAHIGEQMKYTPIDWKFDVSMRKPLSANEVSYWMQTLQKVLKIGVEFEFNLPEESGICDGESNICPCIHLKDSDCWKRCVSSITGCQLLDNDKCPGLKCNQFVPMCAKCPNNERSCGSCVMRSDPEKSPKEIRSRVRNALSPTHSYGRLGSSCCHKVIQDGSLRGDKGMEVVTVGRRVTFDEFYKMNKQIIDLAINNHGYVDELCSIHMHMLTSYYGKINEDHNNDISIPEDINELERVIPGIIVANYHQLCRKYQNAITWMSMGLDSKAHLTRWEKYRMSILDLSPLRIKMSSIVQSAAGIGAKHKYAWANYMFTRFADDDNVDRFHVEMRALDCLMSPSAVAAFACLFHAMFLRAVEISKYGVLHIGGVEWLGNAKNVQKVLMNKSEGWPAKEDPTGRKSDNQGVHLYTDLLTSESLELLQHLKHLLSITGDAYDVLEKLATEPIAFRRVAGKSWKDIEEELRVAEHTQEDAEIAEIIDRYVCLRLITNCNSIESWTHKVKEAVTKERPDCTMLTKRIKRYVEAKQLDGQLVWSKHLGMVIKI